ncbi:hypothetical protein GCM10011611_48780 [Aliidongia dinghuensis]|uniref:Type II secretion system protein n=1 Tax=Aliidongia dinghuensis TaxID=1867774 RepID=A0A8J2YY06_9PROT|nr:hypothetical protein [Aliidongia dinghuensis]GGF36540.1 hypothetical protein GCM10011611_48780 [Aliidongia dinghuensis]
MIEVLIALAIAVLALGALFGLTRSALTGMARAEAETSAAALAESTLEAMGTVAPLRDGDVAELDQGRFHVRATVRRESDIAANGYLVPYVLAASVSWPDGTARRAVALQTIRLGAPR